jgi:hypothetical protein
MEVQEVEVEAHLKPDIIQEMVVLLMGGVLLIWMFPVFPVVTVVAVDMEEAEESVEHLVLVEVEVQEVQV